MNRPGGRCKEREEIGGHADEQDKHFFKIMYGDFRNRVTIPHQFVQHFRGKIPTTIKLDSCNGYPFDVQVVEDFDKLVLQSGWEVFVSVHGIKGGDFLVFKYDGDSRFKVLIFDPSGCEKSSSSLSLNNAPHGGQGWEEPVNTSSSYHGVSMILPQSERRSARTNCGSSSQWNKTINISSSSAPTDSSGDVLSSEDDQEALFVPSPILRNGANLTEVQAKKMKEKVHAIHPKLPIYGTVMTKSNVLGSVCFLDISAKYADAYLPCEDQTMMLQRHDKSWNVGLHVSKNNSKRLYKGWRKFAEENNLQRGDLCLFELLKRKKCRMNVHIIRRR